MADLAYTDRGSGRPVVLLHGITASKRMWEPIVALMEGRYRCVSIDLPGHGDSPDGPYDAIGQAAAVRAVVVELGLDEPLMVGHSLGGMAGTVYSALYGARGVVNIDQPLHLGSFAAMLGPDPTRFRGEGFAEAFDEFAAQLGIDRVPEPRRSALLADVHPRQEVVVAIWADVLDGNVDGVQTLLDSALSTIACPYLVIYGKQPTARERATVEQIPDVTIEVWDDFGHLLHLVDPLRFTHRVTDFEATLP